MDQNKVINLSDKLDLITKVYTPKGIARLNDYAFKLAKIKGDFIWHSHEETDEAFLVLDGTLHIELEKETITINKGELYIVAKGVQHRPFADEECSVLLIEPDSTVNTGTEESSLRQEEIEWI